MDATRIAGIGVSTGQVRGRLAALERQLGEIAASGADFVELFGPEIDVVVGGRPVPARVERVREMLTRSGLRSTIHLPIETNLMDEMHAAMHQGVVRAFIDVASDLGSEALVIHPGVLTPAAAARDLERLRAVERDALKALADAAGSKGVDLCLENILPTYAMIRGGHVDTGIDLRRIAEQVARVDHPFLHGTVDFSHGWIASRYLGFDYPAALAEFAPYVKHLHMHDSLGELETMERMAYGGEVPYGIGDLHLPLGWGTIPFAELLPTLAVRPGTRMAIELRERHWDHLDETVREARRLSGLFPSPER